MSSENHKESSGEFAKLQEQLIRIIIIIKKYNSQNFKLMNLKQTTFRHGYGTGDLPQWAWLYFPIALIAIQFMALEFLEYETYYKLFDTELGLIENLTALFAIFAIITGCLMWSIRSNFPSIKYNALIILLISGSIYTLGEEISWGQHYVEWSTPEWLVELNVQKETNLHNVHDIFGVLPKMFLEWSIYICGIFLTLKFRKINSIFDRETDWKYWILPSFIIFPSSVLALLFRVTDRIETWFRLDFKIAPGETHECLLIYIVLLYMLSLHKRLKQYEGAVNRHLR